MIQLDIIEISPDFIFVSTLYLFYFACVSYCFCFYFYFAHKLLYSAQFVGKNNVVFEQRFRSMFLNSVEANPITALLSLSAQVQLNWVNRNLIILV